MFATSPMWAGPGHFGGGTGNLQSQRLAWYSPIFPNSRTKLVSDTCELVIKYAGDKPGGIWLSPTSRLGTGGSLYPCEGPSASPHWLSK